MRLPWWFVIEMTSAMEKSDSHRKGNTGRRERESLIPSTSADFFKRSESCHGGCWRVSK